MGWAPVLGSSVGVLGVFSSGLPEPSCFFNPCSRTIYTVFVSAFLVPNSHSTPSALLLFSLPHEDQFVLERYSHLLDSTVLGWAPVLTYSVERF